MDVLPLVDGEELFEHRWLRRRFQSKGLLQSSRKLIIVILRDVDYQWSLASFRVDETNRGTLTLDASVLSWRLGREDVCSAMETKSDIDADDEEEGGWS